MPHCWGCGLSLNSSTNLLHSNAIHKLIYITSELRREENSPFRISSLWDKECHLLIFYPSVPGTVQDIQWGFHKYLMKKEWNEEIEFRVLYQFLQKGAGVRLTAPLSTESRMLPPQALASAFRTRGREKREWQRRGWGCFLLGHMAFLKFQIAFLLGSHWLKFSHMAMPSCKGDWECTFSAGRQRTQLQISGFFPKGKWILGSN